MIVREKNKLSKLIIDKTLKEVLKILPSIKVLIDYHFYLIF